MSIMENEYYREWVLWRMSIIENEYYGEWVLWRMSIMENEYYGGKVETTILDINCWKIAKNSFIGPSGEV